MAFVRRKPSCVTFSLKRCHCIYLSSSCGRLSFGTVLFGETCWKFCLPLCPESVLVLERLTLCLLVLERLTLNENSQDWDVEFVQDFLTHLAYSPHVVGKKTFTFVILFFFFPFFYVANLMKKLVLHVLTSLQSEGNLSIWDIAHQDLSARMKQSPSDGTRAADHTRALSSAQVAHPEFLCAITFWSFGQLSWRTVALTFSKWGEYSFSLC